MSIVRTEGRRLALGLRRSRLLWAYLFVSPAIVSLLLFSAGPIGFTLWMSVHEWNLIAPLGSSAFVGIENYRHIVIRDPLFWKALGNTLRFALFGVGINLVLGLLIAGLLAGPLRGGTFWRTLFFMPVVSAPLASAIMWAALLNKQAGFLNGLFRLMGLPAQPFLSSPAQALPSTIGIAVYHYLGSYIIVYLTGMRTLSQSYYDAAALDGANRWQRFRYITLPLMRPFIAFLLISNTIGALQVFDVVYAAAIGPGSSGGGPANSTLVLALHIYNTAFKFLRMGRASAMAILLLIMIVLIILLEFRLLRRERA